MKHTYTFSRLNPVLRIVALLLSLFLLFTFSALSQNILKDEELDKELQVVIDEQIDKFDLKGISVGIQLPDEDPWFISSGFSTPVGNIAFEPEMPMSIASYSKVIMATLTFRLMEFELLNLDDKLADWLPDYPNVNNQITVKQLLNHSSGLFDFTTNINYGRTAAEDLET